MCREWRKPLTFAVGPVASPWFEPCVVISVSNVAKHHGWLQVSLFFVIRMRRWSRSDVAPGSCGCGDRPHGRHRLRTPAEFSLWHFNVAQLCCTHLAPVVRPRPENRVVRWGDSVLKAFGPDSWNGWVATPVTEGSGCWGRGHSSVGSWSPATWSDVCVKFSSGSSIPSRVKKYVCVRDTLLSNATQKGINTWSWKVPIAAAECTWSQSSGNWANVRYPVCWTSWFWKTIAPGSQVHPAINQKLEL